jgi:O-methyltransferase
VSTPSREPDTDLLRTDPVAWHRSRTRIVPEDVGRVSATYTDAARAERVYGEALRTSFEYVYGSRLTGAVVEFGTYLGFTASIIASLIAEFSANEYEYGDHPPVSLYLYDSFEGFPDSASEIDARSYEVSVTGEWTRGGDWVPEGTERRLREHLERQLDPSRLVIVKGFYEQSLRHSPVPEKVALVNLDCDLYESSRLALESLVTNDCLQDGTVILCDDWNCNRANPELGQRRAMRDVFEESAFSYSDFFPYGWHGRAFFVHARDAG